MQIVDCLNDLRRLHLSNLSTDRTYLVTMAVVVITSLIFRRVMKAVAHHQSQFYKELQRVVQGGPADREIVLTGQFFAQLLQRKMAVRTVDGIQYREALRRLSVLVQLQIAGQDIPDGYLNIFSHLMWSNGLKPHKITTFS